MFLILKLTTVTLGLFISLTILGQQEVKGYVFADENGNGVMDTNELGIAGVSVSNGKEVDVTNVNGVYSLPIANDNIIFVIKPSGFSSQINRDYLPQFYRIHKPLGSPFNLKYQGVPPTGKLPEFVNFPLQKVAESNNFSIVIFGDPQISNAEELEFYKRGIINEVKNTQGKAFGITLGDIAANNLDIFPSYIRATANIGIPWYNTLGNHDMNFNVTKDSLSDETFELYFGPTNYAFNFGNVHFIVLDNIMYSAVGTSGRYSSGMRKDQIDFVKNDLDKVEKDKLIVLVSHIPLISRNQIKTPNYTLELFELLAGFPYTLSLSGHTHNQYHSFFSRANGWKQEKPHHHFNVGTTSGNWYSGELNELAVPISMMSDGTEKGYAEIHFKGSEYIIDYKVAGKPEDYQMSVWMPDVLEKDVKASGGVYVNFFMGSEKDIIEYRIDDGRWQKMEREAGYDPTYMFNLLRWDTTQHLLSGKRRPGRPHESNHLWWGRLDNTLPVGEHKVQIRATDMFGRSFFSQKQYTIKKR